MDLLKQIPDYIEILIYVNDEEYNNDGGELLLFSNENNIDEVERKLFRKWQYKRLLTELINLRDGDIIRTSGVAGNSPFKNKVVDFKLEKKVKPLFGRVVILDYRDNYNVHAVAPKSNFNRKSIEQWFRLK